MGWLNILSVFVINPFLHSCQLFTTLSWQIFLNHKQILDGYQTNSRQIPDKSAGWKNPAAAPSLLRVVGDLAQSSWPRSSCTWLVVIVIIIIVIKPMLVVMKMMTRKGMMFQPQLSLHIRPVLALVSSPAHITITLVCVCKHICISRDNDQICIMYILKFFSEMIIPCIMRTNPHLQERDSLYWCALCVLSWSS